MSKTTRIRWKGQYDVNRDADGTESRSGEFVRGRIYDYRPTNVPDYGRLAWRLDQLDGVSATMNVERGDDGEALTLEVAVTTKKKEQRDRVHEVLEAFNRGEVAVPTITREQHRAFVLNGIALRESDGLFGFHRLCANAACKERCDSWCYAEADPDEAIEQASIRGHWFCSSECCLADSNYRDQLEEALLDSMGSSDDFHGIWQKCVDAGFIEYEDGPGEPPTGFKRDWLARARSLPWWADLVDTFQAMVLDQSDGDPPEDAVECEA